jgi:hypothetical protein
MNSPKSIRRSFAMMREKQIQMNEQELQLQKKWFFETRGNRNQRDG